MHQFYGDNTLLFTLENAVEYDTGTPYRYAVSWFVDVANRIRDGQRITVISQSDQRRIVVLQTVEQRCDWISGHFSGFQHYIS